MSKSQTFTAGCSAVGSFSYAGNFTLYVVLTDKNGNAGTNVSQVDYNVYCQSNGSGSINAKHYKYFSINGSEKINVTETVNVSSPYAYISIASGTISVTHDADGSKTIPFSAQIKASSYGVSASVSGNFTLEKIPRYFTSTPSISASSKTLTSITFKWSTSETCDRVDYSLNGTTTTSAWTGSATGGSITISNLSPNTSYSIYVWCRRKDSQLGSTSNTISVTTYDIARLTAAPAVNIGSSHTITWTNPGSATTSLKLCKTDGTQVINYGTVTGTSKTVTPTASTIYALTPNSNSITLRYILTTTQGSYTTTNYKDCKFSVTNSNPTFSNFTYQDTDSTVVALTGNNQTIVKGYSNVQGIVSTANKATAKNSATMSKYRLSIGEATAEVAYSSSAQVSATISNVSSNSFTMYAIDSRGNSTSKTITAATYINYSPIKINSISAVRTNSVTSETTLKFSGYIWNGSFGSVTNAIVTCYYRYRLSTSSTWTTGATTITPTKSGSTFSFSGIIAGDLGATGFNIDNSYIIQVIVADKLSGNSSNPTSFTLGPGTPAMAIYKNNVAIGQRYSTSEGGKLQVNGDTKLKGKVLLTNSPPNFGKCKDVTVQNSYVRLFTLNLNAQWKTTSVWFTVTDTQVSSENLLCNLYVHRGETTSAVYAFNYMATNSGFSRSRLVAVVTSNTTTDVYIKMNANDSPAISILSMTKMFDDDSYGKITIDCSTTITSLPSGTQTTPTGFMMGKKTLSNIGNSGYGTQNEYMIDTSFISFWNGAYDAANASNLLYCNGGTIQPKPTSLYDNSSGTTGTVTLSQTAANFNFLEIFFRDDNNGGVVQSVRCANPNGAKAQMQIFSQSDTDIRHNVQRATVSGTSITKEYGQVNYMSGGRYTVNEIKIIKVVGWK